METDQELNYLTKSLQHHPSPYIIYELDGSIAWANIAAKYIFNLDTLEELSVIKIDEKITNNFVEDYVFSKKLYKFYKFSSDKICIKHDFPSFFKTIKLYLLRSIEWSKLFLNNNTKFNEGGGTSKKNALSAAYSFIFILSIFLSLFLNTKNLSPKKLQNAVIIITINCVVIFSTLKSISIALKKIIPKSKLNV